MNSFDDFLRENISKISDNCYNVINALREGKIDKEVAFSILDNLRQSAVSTFDKRCELFDSAHLDYSGIEESKRSFVEGLDNAVYSITNEEIKGSNEEIDNLLR